METPDPKKNKKLDSAEFFKKFSATKAGKFGSFLKTQNKNFPPLWAKLEKMLTKEAIASFAGDAEDRDILTKVQEDLTNADVSTHVKDESRALRFNLSDQEIEWMDRHPEDSWLRYLIYRYQFKIYPKLKKLRAFPPHLLIEPTSVCNLRCIMCFQVDESFTKKEFMGHMPWELFLKIVDQVKAAKCHAVTLASRGEPTLNPRFGDMLLHLSKSGVLDIKVNTNATRLTEKLAHEVLSAGVSEVVFSVDAGTKETYESIRVRGKFDEVVANVDRFNDIRLKQYSNSPTVTRISGVKVQEDQDEAQMSEFWGQRVDQVTIKEALPRWDSYNNPKLGLNIPCSVLWEKMYVWYDGIVNPCDFDYKSYLKVGDANVDSLSTIWTNERYEKLRKDHLEKLRKNYIPCDRCPIS